MQQFTTQPNSFQQVQNQLLIRYIPIVAILMAFLWFLDKNGGTPSNVNNHNTLWQVMPLMLVALGVGIWQGIRRQKKQFETYTLQLIDEKIICTSDGLPAITIPYNEVRRIIKTEQGKFTISSTLKQDTIHIPSQIEEPDLLEQLLNGIHAVEFKKGNPWLSWLGIVLAMVMIGLLAILLSSNDKWLVGLSGGTLVLGMVISFILIQRSKHLDFRTKQLSYLTFIPLLSFGSIALIKLFQ